MTIKIRKRKASKGISKLYLDIYNPKSEKTRTSFSLDLEFYVAPKNKSERNINKESLAAAEKIKAVKLVELAYENNDLGALNINDASAIDFMDYFEQLTNHRINSANNYGNWDSVLKHLRKFRPTGIPITKVSPKFLEEFKSYLKYDAKTKSNTNLSQNTLYSYFNKVKACLKQAFEEDLILKNPASQVKGFKEGESQREFLTLEELQSVAKAECDIPQLKKAFIFSCLTGMRWSDINNLTWRDFQYSENNGYNFVRFTQQKTGNVETLPISEQARELMGEEGEKEDRVFKGLKYSAWHNVKLQQWVMRAGISKTITFHCARHTYATLQLTEGTDIYTVSKMLGHRELKTTQVYAKIIDQKKVEATHAIPKIEF